MSICNKQKCKDCTLFMIWKFQKCMKNIPFHRIIRMQISSISFVSASELCPPLSLPCPPQGRPGQSKILEDYKTSHHHHHHHHEQQVHRDGLVRGGPGPRPPLSPICFWWIAKRDVTPDALGRCCAAFIISTKGLCNEELVFLSVYCFTKQLFCKEKHGMTNIQNKICCKPKKYLMTWIFVSSVGRRSKPTVL